MDYKKILGMIMMLLMVLTFCQPILAASSSEIKITNAKDTINEITVKHGDGNPVIRAMLYVDNEWRGLRLLEFYLVDNTGTVLRSDYQLTGPLSGVAVTDQIETYNLPVGDYILKVRYGGSHDGEWPEAEKRIPFHITPFTTRISISTETGIKSLTAKGMFYVDDIFRANRVLGFYVTDSNGHEVANDWSTTKAGNSAAKVTFNTLTWAHGWYDIKVRYEGSNDGEWPEAETHTKVFI